MLAKLITYWDIKFLVLLLVILSIIPLLRKYLFILYKTQLDLIYTDIMIYIKSDLQFKLGINWKKQKIGKG